MADVERKNLSRISLFSGSTLAMAASMLLVITLLVWWKQLISKNLQNQYDYFIAAVQSGDAPNELRRFIESEDHRLAAAIFTQPRQGKLAENAAEIIAERLKTRQRMVIYEQVFFIILLLSGHLFFIYIYIRERLRRKQIEETILLATHELRQPLQALLLALESLTSNAKGKSQRAIQAGLKDIDRLGELVRILSGAFAPQKRKIPHMPTSALQNSIGEFVAQEFEGAAARIRYSRMPSETRNIQIDPGAMHFLMRNLIGNALKYSNGPVEIEEQCDSQKFVVRVSNQRDSLSKDDFGKIGRIFYRSATSAVQNTTGFGMGLYLCGRLARKAGGSLVLELDRSDRITATLKLRVSPR